tara:strand:- start:113 stop:349 length:237 start_codon:yes stop_codon:yes gene_type:complete
MLGAPKSCQLNLLALKKDFTCFVCDKVNDTMTTTIPPFTPTGSAIRRLIKNIVLNAKNFLLRMQYTKAPKEIIYAIPV